MHLNGEQTIWENTTLFPKYGCQKKKCEMCMENSREVKKKENFHNRPTSKVIAFSGGNNKYV